MPSNNHNNPPKDESGAQPRQNHRIHPIIQTTNDEDAFLQSRIPQAYDIHGLFDALAAQFLLSQRRIIPTDLQAVLTARIERDLRQRVRPIPDVPGRLPYEPGPASMSGLTTTTTGCGASLAPRPGAGFASSSSSSLGVGGCSSAVAAAAAAAAAKAPGPASTSGLTDGFEASSSTLGAGCSPLGDSPSEAGLGEVNRRNWTDEETALLFRLRARGIHSKETAEFFPGKSEKACQEKYYKTKKQDSNWRRYYEEQCKERRDGRGPRDPPPPPPPAGAAGFDAVASSH